MKVGYWIGVLALLCAATPVAAQQPDVRREPRVLNVNGTGTVQRQPDRAVILIAVESRAQTAQAAAQQNAQKMDGVYASLRKMGIVPPRVATISYELRPDYAQDTRSDNTGSMRVVAYVAVNMVRVELDSIARVGSVIDATVAAGANRIASLSYELRDPEAARLEALELAVKRARAEAEVVAAAAGQRLGPPQSISSSSGWQPQPMYRRMDVEMAMAAAPAPTPVEAGSLTITANVSISYLLE